MVGQEERFCFPMRLSLRWDRKATDERKRSPVLSDVLVARSSGSAETQAATQAQEGTEFIRLLWLNIVEGGYDDTMTDEKNSKIGRCLIKDGKGVFDAVIETNPQLCPCKTKDRRWKVLR